MGFFDELLGDNPAAEQKKFLQKGLNQLYLGQQAQAPLLAESKQAILKQLASVQKGYGEAKKGLALASSAARVKAGDRERRDRGGIAQGLISSGLGGTTRAVGGDTTRALLAVDAALAEAQAGLAAQGGSAVGGAYGNLASILLGISSQKTDLFKSKAALLGNVQVAGGGGILDILAKVGGTAAKAFVGV